MATLTEVTRPSTADGQHAPALRFGDPRVMATMTAIVGYSHLLTGFDNKTLTALMNSLLDAPYTSRQATYDLRRLRRKGIIERTEHSHRYRLTPQDGRSRSCSPRHTGASCTRPVRTRLDHASRSRPTERTRHRLATPRPRTRPIHRRRTRRCMIVQLGLTVNPVVTKRS